MSESSTESPKVRHVRVDADREGQRIDNFLLGFMKGAPRSLIYRVLRKGEVRVNKGRVKADYRLQADDLVRIPPVRLPESGGPASVPKRQLEALEAAIVYEDNRLMVINKPSGMAVHGGSGVSYGVIEGLRKLRPKEANLELVHRLDRDTSGCLLVAKRRSMLRWLHEQIRKNAVDKRYQTLVAGRWQRKTATVDVPLRKNTLKSGERIVRVDREGKSSKTFFRRMRLFRQATLLEAKLDTGRTHQIRVHLQHLGTPVLGDGKYGDKSANAELRKQGLNRLFLHASALKFDLPDGQGRFEIEVPLPPKLETVLTQLAVTE